MRSVGHDISAYLGPDEPSDPFQYLENWPEHPEIAYLRRGASNPLRHQLYEALDAREYDGDVSGVWAARWFNRQELELALVRLRARKDEGLEVDPEIEFIADCLEALPPDRSRVFITFG